MATATTSSKPLGLSIVIGIAIGTLAALLSGHVAVWLIAGVFVGIAAGAAIASKKCPECDAREHGGMRASSYEPRANKQGAPGSRPLFGR